MPGIAIYNRATLGGYWKVTAANGKTAILKQTDLGPAPFTGRQRRRQLQGRGKEPDHRDPGVVGELFLGDPAGLAQAFQSSG